MLKKSRNGAVGEGYVIRVAGAGDREAVARELAAYLDHIGEALDAAGLDRDIAHWEREYDGVSGVMLVVEGPEGAIVGTAAVRRLDEGIGEIKRMWIRPHCQGKGLGHRLIARCLDEARSRGYRAVRLDTESKMAAALHLYRRAGFTEISDYNNNRRAQVWMERAL
jgi:ribosomal protein S18 acetylase RimI-like enzyme